MADIEGLLVLPLKIVGDDRGRVMHYLRSDEPHFKHFGEAYVSQIYSGVTKGWKLHTLSTSNMVVPVGMVRFVFHDRREGSPTFGQFQEVTIGEDNYQLLVVPPHVLYAWRNEKETIATVLNCATELWSPNESSNIPLETYTYSW